MGAVGVLPAGATARREPPFDLRKGDHAGSTHPQTIIHETDRSERSGKNRGNRNGRVVAVANYLSFVEQLLHYFDRPHTGPAHRAIGGPAAWRGIDLQKDPAWIEHLTPDHLIELDHALAAARATGRPLGELTAADFPLPTLELHIARWRAELSHGRGFVLIRGLPVGPWTDADAEVVFWCLGQHLGRPGAQNSEGDLLGHVRDFGDDVNHPAGRKYRTNHDIRYHCDAADVVGLLCLRPALEGGASRLVSSVAVYDQLLSERPDLVDRLFEPFLLDARNEEGGGLPYTPVQPCCFADGQLRTFFHSDYFRSVDRHPGIELTARDLAVLDGWEEIAERPEMRLDMDLAAGDIQLVSNHTVAHARTAYIDDTSPERQRHLLRLWLSLI